MRNENTSSKLKLQALALAALLPMAAQASDRWEHRRARQDLSGSVEVTKEVPGGVITVGAEWGKPRPEVVVVENRRPEVVVVENRRPEVIVIEKERGHGRRHHYGHKHHRHGHKHVTVIREVPREVVIVKERPACGPATVVEHVHRDAHQVSVQRTSEHGTYHYYKDGNQVSERRTGPDGTYHYYEDAHQVSIQDNRDGKQRNVYVRK